MRMHDVCGLLSIYSTPKNQSIEKLDFAGCANADKLQIAFALLEKGDLASVNFVRAAPGI